MTVLELMATLGLDTTAFDDELSGAVKDVQHLENEATKLNQKPTTSGGSILSPVKEDAESVDAQLLSLQQKTEETSSIMKGFADATNEVVQKTIEGIIEFGKQSIEAAASTESELANAFNASRESFEMGLDATKVKAGEALIPIAEWFYDVGDALFGANLDEKLEIAAQQLQVLAGINLDKTRESVKGIFGAFEEVGDIEVGSISDFSRGLESQTAYWEKYAETLDSLREKGLGEDVLGELAAGTEESLGVLAALDQADPAQLEEFASAYAKLQESQEKAAASISESTLSLSEDANAIAEAIAVLSAENYEEVGVEGTAAGRAIQENIETLEASYPVIASIVEQINEELGKLGMGENPLSLSLLGEGEEGEEEGVTAKINLVASEGSEGELQGAVDDMDLEGEALVSADPASGSRIQSYLDSLNLTAIVKLIPDDSSLGGYKSSGEGRAVGLDYVPYDEYPARLHEGEAVLTKLEAERWRRGEGRAEGTQDGGGNIAVTQYITVASNEDFETAVYHAMERARWNA